MLYLQSKLGKTNSKLGNEAFVDRDEVLKRSRAEKEDEGNTFLENRGRRFGVAGLHPAGGVQFHHGAVLLQHPRTVLVLFLPGGLGEVLDLPAAGIPHHHGAGGGGLPVFSGLLCAGGAALNVRMPARWAETALALVGAVF